MSLNAMPGTEKSQREFSLGDYFFTRLKLAAFKNELLDALEWEVQYSIPVSDVREITRNKLYSLWVTYRYVADFEQKYTPPVNAIKKYEEIYSPLFRDKFSRWIHKKVERHILETWVWYFSLLEIAKKKFQEKVQQKSDPERFIPQLQQQELEVLIWFIYILPHHPDHKRENIVRFLKEEKQLEVPQILFQLCDTPPIKNPRK